MIKNSKTKDIYTYTAKYANFNDYDLVTNQEVGEIKINKYNGNASTLVIPQFVGGMQVIIGDNSFLNNQTLINIKLPKCRINMGAFNYCMNLKTMFIPKNVIIGPQILSVSRELIIYSEESSMPLNLWDELWAKQGMGYSKIIWNTTESEYDNKIIGDIN